MKTFQSMAIGMFIIAVLTVVLQPLPNVQLLVVLAALVCGLVALVSLAIEAFSPAKARSAPQPVAQPVAKPVDMVLQPPQPITEIWPQPAQPSQPVADRWSQPLATAPQPARNRDDEIAMMASMILDEVPDVRHVPWLQQKVAPVAVDDDPAELPDVPEPALPLPRRAPTAAEYPLLWQTIIAASSRNEAIVKVYGSKDGKTHRWVSRVFDFYTRPGSGYETPVATSEAVFRHELIGTCDMPGMVAARLGLEVNDDQLADLMAGLEQCDDCSAWYSVSGDCACQREEVD